MRAPSSAQLLDAWERALSDAPALRPAVLLASTCDEESVDALASMPIGERDRRLLRLREWTFGPTLASVADCARCGERLEWTARVSDLFVAGSGEPVSEVAIDDGDYHVRCRLPNSLDVHAVVGLADRTAARERLLRRCLLNVECRGETVSVGENESLPAALCDAISTRMSEADPQADHACHLTCPACNHQWTASFDIGSFFWSEVTAWADRLLNEVHTLACAYGWREQDILTLSPWRRQFYLNLVGV